LRSYGRPELYAPRSVARAVHHKFVVIGFDKPKAREQMGPYNFSNPADVEN